MPTDHPPIILLVLGALAVLGLIALVRLLGTPRSALPYRRKPGSGEQRNGKPM